MTAITSDLADQSTRVSYVSPDLCVLEISADEAKPLARDLTQADADRARVYRRLDREWYQWLYHALVRAGARCSAGAIDPAQLQAMERRFERVRALLYRGVPGAGVEALERSLPDARYLPPRVRDQPRGLAITDGVVAVLRWNSHARPAPPEKALAATEGLTLDGSSPAS